MLKSLTVRSSLVAMAVASAISLSAQAASDSAPDQTKSSDAGLEEVLVTAQKREERLQDVPVPVSTISTDALVENNQTRLQDYFSAVPGLNVTPVGNGGLTMISIRGISSGAYTPATVSITVDDVPTYSGLASVYGNVQPDLDPSDLARVEVLRGPQGTLYGASSMGGLIKYVTVDPSTTAVSGRVEAGTSTIHNGAELGYSFRGSANIPLSDTVAMRASAFTRQDPGYIDNPVLGKDGVNEDHVSGGRLSVLWRPSDNLSAKFSALYQDYKGDGQNDIDVPTTGYPQTNGLSGLQQNYLRGTGGYEQKVQTYSAIVKAKVGIVDLVSVSGYTADKWYNSQDFSFVAPSLAQSAFGVTGVALLTYGKDEKFTQEIRASMPLGSKLDWLVGAFYTHENYPGKQSLPVVNPDTGAVVGSMGFDASPNTYIESAVFTDFTVHLTDRFDVQLGGRESRIEQQQNAPAIQGGLLFGPTLETQTPNSTTNVFTYLLTPQYKVSPDLMVYARFASGFRAGQGFNIQHLTQPNIPAVQDPDKTKNYEIGVKGDVLNHTLSYDASVYYIDWKGIQLTLVDPVDSTGYGANGGGAKSEGVELAVEARPLPGLSIASWITYDEAVLTESLGADSTAYGPAGSRLPFGTRWSGNISLKQEFRITDSLTGFAGGAVSYVGDRMGAFLGDSTPRQNYPGYVRTDVNAGVNYGEYTANLYVNNLADRRGVSGGGLGTTPVFAFQYIQPRTIGLSLIARF